MVYYTDTYLLTINNNIQMPIFIVGYFSDKTRNLADTAESRRN